MAGKRLVISGDDLGLLPGIDRGLALAADRGSLTSISLLANGPRFEEGVRVCRERPGIGVGIHLALVEGRALTAWNEGGMGRGAEQALPDGYRQFVAAWMTGRIRRRRVEIELRRQIERMLEAGVRPDHLDGHQHLHLFPPLAGICARLGREYGIQAVRLPGAGGAVGVPRGGAGRWKSRLVVLFAGLSRGRYSGFYRPGAVLGVGESGRLTPDDLRWNLEAFAAGPCRTAELMCHPGDGDAGELRRGLRAAGYRSPWRSTWREELDLLCSKELTSLLFRLDISLCTYRDLASQ